MGEISALPYTIVKQSFTPNSNLLFLPLFSLSKNSMHIEIWGFVEIIERFLPFENLTEDFFRRHAEKKHESKDKLRYMSNHSKNIWERKERKYTWLKKYFAELINLVRCNLEKIINPQARDVLFGVLRGIKKWLPCKCHQR